jgi:hypothetical protein
MLTRACLSTRIQPSSCPAYKQLVHAATDIGGPDPHSQHQIAMHVTCQLLEASLSAPPLSLNCNLLCLAVSLSHTAVQALTAHTMCQHASPLWTHLFISLLLVAGWR